MKVIHPFEFFFQNTSDQTTNKTEFLQSPHLKCNPIPSIAPFQAKISYSLNTAIFGTVDPPYECGG